MSKTEKEIIIETKKELISVLSEELRKLDCILSTLIVAERRYFYYQKYEDLEGCKKSIYQNQGAYDKIHKILHSLEKEVKELEEEN